MKKFFAMENRGELPQGKAEEWAHETPDIKSLPEHKKQAEKKASKKRKKLVKKYGAKKTIEALLAHKKKKH